MVNHNGKSVVVKIPTQAQAKPNEASPLNNQRMREIHSDASSVSAVTSEQTIKKLIQTNMPEQSKNVTLRVCIDFLILCCGE